MRLRARLRLLEESMAGRLGCPGCRHRHGAIYRTSTPLPDGTPVWDVEKPLPCPHCGKISELIIDVIMPVMEERNGRSESGSSV